MDLARNKDSNGTKIIMLEITEREALEIILSLSNQLVAKDCNWRRLESYTKKGEYFSIAVMKEE